MNEDEARSWVREHFGVSRETQLNRYADMLVAEAQEQNLIAASTLDTLWPRHLVDSAQLIHLAAEAPKGAWLDVGSGPGLPGIVVAILGERDVVLCEPRTRRVAFLAAVVEALGLNNVTIRASKVEGYLPAEPAAIVSARAVAELSVLLRSTAHCTESSTIWVLPKGRNALSEVAAARRKWQGVFHVEPSITQSDSGIVVAQGVRPK